MKEFFNQSLNKNFSHVNKEEAFLEYPERITLERISFLCKKGIEKDIASIDLEMVKMKLQDKDEGLGWTKDYCDKAELEYKRYLHLCRKYGKGIVPTKIMDTFWHYHILDSRAYISMSDKVFGGYLHHYPYFGMRGEQDKKNLELASIKTKERYFDTFGETVYLGKYGTDCWHDCEDRCHNACKSSGI